MKLLRKLPSWYCGNFSARRSRSKSRRALISRNSTRTRMSSVVVLRRRASVARHSSSRSRFIRWRGLCGMKSTMPAARMVEGRSWRQTGTSQAASDWPSPVPPMKLVP